MVKIRDLVQNQILIEEKIEKSDEFFDTKLNLDQIGVAEFKFWGLETRFERISKKQISTTIFKSRIENRNPNDLLTHRHESSPRFSETLTVRKVLRRKLSQPDFDIYNCHFYPFCVLPGLKSVPEKRFYLLIFWNFSST